MTINDLMTITDLLTTTVFTTVNDQMTTDDHLLLNNPDLYLARVSQRIYVNPAAGCSQINFGTAPVNFAL